MSPVAKAVAERAFMAIRNASAGLPESTTSSSSDAVIEATDCRADAAGRATATITITIDDLMRIVAESRWD